MTPITWRRGCFALLAACVGIAGWVIRADALYRGTEYGDMDLSGRLRATNIVRHQDWDNLAFIMQRNELKLRFEWKWLQRGKAFKRWQVPWLSRSDLFMVYRGIYDSTYDITPGQIERKDLSGRPLSARDVSLETISKSTRDQIKFNNRIREAYLDLYFKHIPLTLRVGKQQVVWGESDGFRMLDRANTLDLSWHFFQELPPPGFGFDELRKPFWMIKGLWDFKQLGPLSQPFLEFYWNPGDWDPGDIAFLPRPWGVRILDPISNAKGTGALQSSFCDPARVPGLPPGTCASLFKGTTLFRQGDYRRNPLENSQFGVRFHFITPQGFELTFNYLYQRWSPDGSPTALVRGIPFNRTIHVKDTNPFVPGNQPGDVPAAGPGGFCDGLRKDPASPFSPPWAANQLCLEYFAPYIHTIGFSMNYFEADWTQTVWRLETIIDFNLPFYDGDKQVALFGSDPNCTPGNCRTSNTLLPGITHKNMWKGMLAFDRPTWIKWLNKQTTFFVTGQLFWHYIINHERRRCAIGDDPANGYTASPKEPCGSADAYLLPGEQTGLIGPLDFPTLDEPQPKQRDTIHQWEILGTLAVLGFYRGGSLVPALIYLLDPVNSYSQELAFGIDWFIRPDIAVNFTTRLIWAGAPWDAYDGHKSDSDPDEGEIFDPWFLAGGSRGRSESGIMFTWQF